MNRCDDRAGPLFATEFLTRAVHGPWAEARPVGRPNRLSCRFVEEARSYCLQAPDQVNCACAKEHPLGEKKFVADKGTIEGAAAFMNTPG